MANGVDLVNFAPKNEMKSINYHKSYYISFSLRVFINFVFLIIIHFLMISSVKDLPKFSINLLSFNRIERNSYEVSSYLFDETAILITLGGLIVVALMALLVSLGFFRIIPKERQIKFRVRLFIYTITNLAICCITTLYLFFIAATMVSISSYRINLENGFIWIYPFYAMVIIFYLIEVYGFMTVNYDYFNDITDTVGS